MNSNEIERYIDSDTTALCPYCQIDSIIPDAIEFELNSQVIDEMNKYWF